MDINQIINFPPDLWSQEVRKLREQLPIPTATSAAAQLGYDAKTWRRWEAGQRPPRATQIGVLVYLHWMLGVADKKPTEDKMSTSTVEPRLKIVPATSDPGSRAEAILRSGLVQRASSLPAPAIRQPLTKPSGKII